MKKKLLSILLMMVVFTTMFVGCGNAGKSEDELYELGKECYDNEDYETAYEYFVQASEKGSGIAYGMLGNMYKNGYYVEQSQEKAFEYWKLAVGKDGVDKSYERGVGLCYLYGDGVEKNVEEGLRWLESAAEKGDGNANRELGVRYFEGIDVAQDYEKALYYFEKGSQYGESYCAYMAGVMYCRGFGVEVNYYKGIDYLILSGESGYVNAYRDLSLIYWNGESPHGVDKELAREYIQKALDAGYDGDDVETMKELLNN